MCMAGLVTRLRAQIPLAATCVGSGACDAHDDNSNAK
eukprot:CAMPEP_0194757362 /NCGR_PEP_ID=MMETSP0323_2-20130528/10872_1 /TAXON_ID=2866 ORGANISM="Crypthecodinium cohnii, Strain Seligo" /NCGR_SAMPLE_ID=MMETSP0323_2 /ASSEMBLY_ACC=CAM_ASM_000346 /LENGTH=36 /DNA_ID= /DNA_START= /DNA_END= /DNA_ORIENTATION=